ncbi:electron transfer flavoprotein subunit alpha/FixB family protein [Anaerovorax sp. IOR16]|uniref:electron transfer flavoprotein subunit alpha/FixB family protein n=1 Tax=Anaerovorax sp. IOR16 TaxID=2773458 RepID=UPI0019D117E4|nr:electron transfer flavoprotein subunit alpha/FixB family protein [Anaerovorax sp. IOR16]
MDNKKQRGILVIAEQSNGEIHKVSYELLNKGRELAEQRNMPLDCLLLGGDGIPAEELNYRGAQTVYYMKDSIFSTLEEYTYKKNIVAFIEEKEPEIVLIGATNFGRSLAPRIAAALCTGLTADCTDLQINDEGRLIQIRPAFSDHLFAHIKTVKNPQMATVRYKEFAEAKRDLKNLENIIFVKPYFKQTSKSTVDEMIALDDFDITEAEVIVAGGRGIRRKEDLAMLEELAKVLGGKVGVSRALVDAGMAESSAQVGYSGNRVKPKVYIACGISGAPQHLAGMKDSQVIIAVNSDPSAPIFQIADYGYVGDLYEVIPQFTRQLRKEDAVK